MLTWDLSVRNEPSLDRDLMPTISLFFGIVVTLYFGESETHSTPHLHARYGDHKAAVSISDGRVLAGRLPRRQLRLLQAWIEIHREDLLQNWALVCAGEPPFRIEPLR